ncbi:hypothetical protein KY331_05475 [Candidatus Woesearchaeota archaeon]|nr:hypothetical protein [Candidatus Woesearchaeota archaeon]
MADMLDRYRGQIGNKTADVIYRLAKRARLPRNKKVYNAGAIDIDLEKAAGYKGPRKISMLDFFLMRDESPDSEIGRFLFHDQQSVTEPHLLPDCVVAREKGDDVIADIRIPVKDEIMRFYMGFLDKICMKGDNPLTYGETVHADADIIYHVNDRLMSGKAIAESKLNEGKYANRIRENLYNNDKLAEILRDEKREKDVITEARRIAEACGFNPDHAEEFVRWMMNVTLRTVEVEYLRRKLGKTKD